MRCLMDLLLVRCAVHSNTLFLTLLYLARSDKMIGFVLDWGLIFGRNTTTHRLAVRREAPESKRAMICPRLCAAFAKTGFFWSFPYVCPEPVLVK
jgi:hypothetical protein